jgi:hypothetical protein
MDIWNHLVSILLLPGIEADTRTTVLKFLYDLNKYGQSDKSIEVAYNAHKWLQEQIS